MKYFNKTALLLTVCWGALLVAGCTGGPAEVAQEPNGTVSVKNNEGFGSVTLVKLEDGTKCAVLIGYNKGGIHCDWKGN